MSACTPATAMPVAAYAASSMCSACWNAAGLRIAATGSIVAKPPAASRVNPVGAFIQAFTSTTNTADAAPLTATTTPAARCARGPTRSHP